MGSGESILVTGPAACGKSTLTKQYTYRIATEFLRQFTKLQPPPVPLLVTAIVLSSTIEDLGLKATDDVLAKHIHRTFGSPLAEFFIRMREQKKLILILDGMDEAGTGGRAALEEYVAKRLAQEVLLCLTGRENGINDMRMFDSFVHFHIQALSETQQRQIATSRMALSAVRKGEVTLDERVTALVVCTRAAACVSFVSDRKLGVLARRFPCVSNFRLVARAQVQAFIGEMQRGYGTLGNLPGLHTFVINTYTTSPKPTLAV